jgi:PBP1b-binding outer membrane lipoprotein LpoB
MKKDLYIALFFTIIFLLLTGCSTTYNATNYKNNEEFYKDFNNSANNKRINIALVNDSSFAAPEGAEIKYEGVMINYPDYYLLS